MLNGLAPKNGPDLLAAAAAAAAACVLQQGSSCISLRHVQSLRCSQEYLFLRTSARKQLYPPGDMRYTTCLTASFTFLSGWIRNKYFILIILNEKSHYSNPVYLMSLGGYSCFLAEVR